MRETASSSYRLLAVTPSTYESSASPLQRLWRGAGCRAQVLHRLSRLGVDGVRRPDSGDGGAVFLLAGRVRQRRHAGRPDVSTDDQLRDDRANAAAAGGEPLDL